MPWRRLWKAGALSSGALLAAGAVAAVPGSIAFRDQPGGSRGWLASCARHQPRSDRILLHRCSRVTGRVLVVRREGAGGSRDTHVLLTARLHLFVVKLEGRVRAPATGSYVTVEGALVRASNGLREIDAWAAT
jgi:hypothetical protein